MGVTRSEDEGDAFGDLVGVLRWLLVIGAVVALVPVAASLVLRQVDVTTPRLVGYVAGTPVVLVAGVAAVVLFVAGGSKIGVAVAGVLTALLALTQVPLYLGTASPAAGSKDLTVMTLNMYYGEADADQIVAAVRDHGVELLAVQELTDEGVDALRRAGIEELLPHHALEPLDSSSGSGLWSTAALDAERAPDRFRHRQVAATATLAGRELFVASVHPVSPYPDDTPRWSAEMGALDDWFGDVDGPAVILGDFNATPDHHQFRALLDTDLADAAIQVGAGWLPTFPAHRRRLPLLITIDHVLASDGIVATELDRLEIDGTDHTALVARLAVPPGV